MIGRDLDIPLPVLGLFEARRATRQPVLTTPDCVNVIDLDPNTGRETLAQRPTLQKYLASQINGSSPVQELVPFVKDAPGLGTFAYHAAATSVTLKWAAKLPAAANVGDNLTALCVDRQGSVYAIAGDTGIVKVSADGEEVWFHPVELTDTGWTIREIRLDPLEENLYLCIGGGGSAAGLVIRYELTDDGPVKRWAWAAPNSGLFPSIAVGFGYLYAVENVTAPAGHVHRLEAIDTEEPVLVWSKATTEQGAHVTTGPDGSAYVSFPGTSGPITNFTAANPTVVTSAAHKLTSGDVVEIEGSTGGVLDDSNIVTVASDDTFTLPVDGSPGGTAGTWYKAPKTRRYDAAGDIKWTFSPAGEGGHGYGAVFWEGYLYTVGHTVGDDLKVLRRILDAESSATADWSLTTAAVPATDYQGCSLAVDGGGRLFYVANTGGSTTNLVLIAAAGAVTWSHSTTNDVGEPNVVALDPWSPDGERAEYIYVGGTRRADYSALFKLRVGAFPSSLNNASPRTLHALAVANGASRVFTASAVATPADAGTYTLNTSKQYVMGLFAYRRVFIIDGQRDTDLEYDPYTGANGTVGLWRAVKGRFTPRPRVLSLHNGRIVRARFPNNPHFWEMSRVGDPYDMDVFPVEQSPEQAVNGTTSGAGLCPDIINGWINWSDDLSIILGDHSIWRLTGDPAGGGRFDLVSDAVGGAFGRAWAKDPRGTIYFFGSRGGVYAMAPGGLPERLRGAQDGADEGSIDARLAAVDLGLNKVMLAWDEDLRGLWVFVTPYAGGAAVHYFWSGRRRSWWPVELPNTMNPYAVAVADGDAPADRVLLIPGSDGYVRCPDADGTADDGTAVEAYFVVGPIMAGGLERETLLTGLRGVVAAVTGGQTVSYAVYAGETPVFADASLVYSGTWTSGRNDWVWERARGSCVFIKIGRYAGGQSAGRWAMESLAARVKALGAVRNR
jgi:hypothetical protein